MNSQNNIIDVFVPVDTENVFKLLGKSFKIDESVKEYKVTNPAVYDESGKLNNFSNESFMEMVHVVLEEADVMRFYNQNEKEISPLQVTLIG